MNMIEMDYGVTKNYKRKRDNPFPYCDNMGYVFASQCSGCEPVVVSADGTTIPNLCRFSINNLENAGRCRNPIIESLREHAEWQTEQRIKESKRAFKNLRAGRKLSE